MYSFKPISSFKRILSFVLCAMMIICMIPAAVQTAQAETGYDRGYPAGMPGEGAIRAHGVDVSAWQESGLNFQNFKNAGYNYVILRCGTSYGKDRLFEEYYANAKAAGLDVGCYFYSYALSAAEARQEAYDVISWIQGKVFEYPVYFDFEDPTQMDLSGSASAAICRGFLDVLKDNGYLPGLYSYAWKLSNDWVTTSGIRSTYEAWVAHVDSAANNTGITSGIYNNYVGRYSSTYGMHQYSFTTYVNGVGPFDANVCYKDYPTLVKTYGFNGYGSWVEQAAFDVMVYRDRNDDLKDMTDAQLRQHWLDYGIKEGRAASAILDLKYYLNNNPDLKAKFGTDYEAAYNHFVTEGYMQHRKSSLIFDGQYYCDNNADVVYHYQEKYLLHYIDHGMKEGRRASQTFDVKYWVYAHPDVDEVWPNNPYMATRHYAGHGIKGGFIGYDANFPVISNVQVTNVSAKGYTITCTITDDWGLSKVAFPSWTDENGNDDLAEDFINTQTGTKNGNTYTFTVKASDHGNTLGSYTTHIYAIDNGGNTTVQHVEGVLVGVTETKLTLTSSSSYSINNKLLNNVGFSTTVTKLTSNFTNKSIKVLNKNGKEITGSAIVGTGCTVNLYENNKLVDSITVIVLADVDGNGIVDTTDYMKVKAAFLSGFSLNSTEKVAADMDGNKIIDTTDYVKIKSYLY